MTYWLYQPDVAITEETDYWPVLTLHCEAKPGDTVFIYQGLAIDRICRRKPDSGPCRTCGPAGRDCKARCFTETVLPRPLPRLALAASPAAWAELQNLEHPSFWNQICLEDEVAEWLEALCLNQVEVDLAPPPQVGSTTEVQRLEWERLTQGAFRASLLERWEGRCAVTGLAAEAFLRASHIKPWAVASDEERMDPDNGLLLAVNYDFAFDKNFITFQDTGVLEIHPSVDGAALATLGIDGGARISRELNGRQRAYLRHHREKFLHFNPCR